MVKLTLQEFIQVLINQQSINNRRIEWLNFYLTMH